MDSDPKVLEVCNLCRLVHDEMGGWVSKRAYGEATGIDPTNCCLNPSSVLLVSTFSSVEAKQLSRKSKYWILLLLIHHVRPTVFIDHDHLTIVHHLILGVA